MSSRASIDAIDRAKSDDDKQDFSGPRAKYGSTIPFVFGTLEIRSPICIWGGVVELKQPFEISDPSVPLHYRSTLDLVLCERVHTDGEQVGAIRLRKLWYGQNLLWDGSAFTTPVSTSENLLRHDPNGNDDSLIPGGGHVDVHGRDRPGWWFGGIVSNEHGVESPLFGAQWRGNVLAGAEKVASSGVWARYLGLEKISFYVGSGSETQDPLGEYIFGPDWNTSAAYKYPSYHKFARLVFHDFFWGPEPQIKDISAEVTVTCPAPEIGDATGLMPNGLDVNPVSVLYTLLTHPDFCGGPKLPGVDTTSFSAARATIEGEQLGSSWILQEPSKASELVKELLELISAKLYIDPTSGLMCLALYRPVDYDPPKFNESHVTVLGDISKTTWAAAYSQCRVKFEMRGASGTQQGADNVAVAKDPALIANNGLVETIDREFATIYDPKVAADVAAKLLSESNTPRVEVALTLTRELSDGGTGVSAIDLRPDDAIILDFAPLEITNLRLRVVKSDLGTLDENGVSVTTIQDLYQAKGIIAPPGQPDGYTVIEPPAEVEIGTWALITAPYLVAKAGLTGDARRQLTTIVIPEFDDGEADLGNKPRAINYDRFFVLARKPYADATAFRWSLAYAPDYGNADILTKSVPYTPCALVDDAQTVFPGGSLNIRDMDPEALAMIRETMDLARDGSGVVYIGGVWLVVAGFTPDEEDETAGALTLTAPTLDTEVRQGSGLFFTGDTPIFFCNLASVEWMQARLGPLLESNYVWAQRYYNLVGDEIPFGQAPYHVYYQEPFGVAFSIYQRFAFLLQNIDPAKVNIPVISTTALEDRANALLPPLRFQCQQVDPGDATPLGDTQNTPVIAVSTGETEFAICFSPITGDEDEYSIFNPRESDGSVIEPRVQRGERIADLTDDYAEYLPTEAAANGPDRRARLEVWYKYGAIDAEGDTLRHATVSPSNKRIFTFECAPSGSTTAVDIYVRQMFGGDRTEANDDPDVVQRLSVPRIIQLPFSRT